MCKLIETHLYRIQLRKVYTACSLNSFKHTQEFSIENKWSSINLHTLRTHNGFKGIVVNLALPFLHEGSFEISLTVTFTHFILGKTSSVHLLYFQFFPSGFLSFRNLCFPRMHSSFSTLQSTPFLMISLTIVL